MAGTFRGWGGGCGGVILSLGKKLSVFTRVVKGVSLNLNMGQTVFDVINSFPAIRIDCSHVSSLAREPDICFERVGE